MRLRHGIPSQDAFSRLFRLLDPVAFHACFTRLMRRVAEATQGAIDRKTRCHAFDRAAGFALHPIRAWAADQRLVLGQLAANGKSNEITAGQRVQVKAFGWRVRRGDSLCPRLRFFALP